MKNKYYSLILILVGVLSLSVNAESRMCKGEDFNILKLLDEGDLQKRIKSIETSSLFRKKGCKRQILLPYVAKDLYIAGDIYKAQAYANELIEYASDKDNDFNKGAALHAGNVVLGLISLSNGKPSKALEYLKKASKSSTTPMLARFGPNLLLAHELLKKGYDKEVIVYLEDIKKIWLYDGGRLDTWIVYIERGWSPDFGLNLEF